MAAKDVTGAFELNQAALSQRVQPVLRREVTSLTLRIATQARADVPVRTGQLGRSITADPVKVIGPFRVEGGVTARTHYAAAVHEGTRPHVIRPRRASVLAFEVGGRKVFAREVHHPGTKARPFLTNAAKRVIGRDV